MAFHARGAGSISACIAFIKMLREVFRIDEPALKSLPGHRRDAEKSFLTGFTGLTGLRGPQPSMTFPRNFPHRTDVAARQIFLIILSEDRVFLRE